jgi:cell division transport system permease protein
MARAPFVTLLTISVIGVTLALPALLHVVVSNFERMSGQWQGRPQAVFYLHRKNTAASAEELAAQWRRQQGVAAVEVRNPHTALDELRAAFGFRDLPETAGENPLPWSLVVTPTDAADTPEAIEALLAGLKANPAVETLRLDMKWVQRLHVILAIAHRSLAVLAAVLALAVLLIIGNTIRDAVTHRREEIEIVSLVGGTGSFVRRPFLYSGLLQGLFGGLIAWLLVSLSVWLVSGPVRRLAGLYGSSFQLAGLSWNETGLLLLGSSLLGWLAARVTVGHQLSRLVPK